MPVLVLASTGFEDPGLANDVNDVLELCKMLTDSEIRESADTR
jgi:hypothetical protein